MSEDPERAAWDAIVANLEADPELARLRLPEGEPPHVDADLVNLDDTEDFTPPEPPPIPRPADVIARFAWAAVIGGPVLLLASSALSLGSFLSGVGAILGVAGFVTLIARRSERSPDEQWGEDHFGDGAIR
mgnify:FL=1